MSYTDLDPRIIAALQANVPCYVSGPPGIGKSERIEKYLTDNGFFFPLIPPAVVSGPEDFNGYPYGDQETKSARFYAPSWALDVIEAHEAKRRIACVFDELTNASPATQKATLQVFLTRRVGQIQLPMDTRMVAMGNPPEASGLYDLDAALANRMIHVPMQANHLEWAEGLVSNFGREGDGVGPEEAQARVRIASFIRRQAKLLHSLPTDDSERGKAWPSPRTWEMATRLLGTIAGADRDTQIGVVASAVGMGAAKDWDQYDRTLDLPNPEDLLANPKSFKLPTESDLQFAVLQGIASAVEAKMTQKRYETAVGIMAEAAAKVFDLSAACVRRLTAAGQKAGIKIEAPAAALKVFWPMLKAAGMIPGVR